MAFGRSKHLLKEWREHIGDWFTGLRKSVAVYSSSLGNETTNLRKTRAISLSCDYWGTA